MNKRVVEHLIKVGAFDALHPNRHALSASLERAFERGHRLAKNKEQSQTSLFATFEQDAAFKEETQGYADVPDWLNPSA